MVSLNTPIEQAPRISKKIVPALKKLGIKAVRDLLFHFPSRYQDFSNLKPIAQVKPGETVTVLGKIIKIGNRRTLAKRMVLTEALLRDENSGIKVLWFNQPFLTRNLKSGDLVNMSGKVALGREGKYLQNPAYEKVGRSPNVHTGGLVPVYPETRGITSRWLRFLINSHLHLSSRLPDPLPEEIRKKFNLPEIKKAVTQIHFPKTYEDAEKAQKRFDFEELMLIQLRVLKERLRIQKEFAPAISLNLPLIKKLVQSLPFKLTDAQRRSLWEILNDLAKPHPMNRMLEGDVGSGKTVVAAAAALNAASSGFKTAFMAPTEILARQHYQTLQKVLAPFDFKIGLLTGSEKKVTPDMKIIVGTHALIQKNVRIENLGLVILDEQHRFGVNQRAALARNPNIPNTPEFTETNPDVSELDRNERKPRETRIVEKSLSYRINGILFKIHQKLGRFCRERQYADAFEQKLKEAGIEYIRESSIPVADRKSNFADFIIENRIIVELKAKPFTTNEDYEQTMRYLQTANLELAILANFKQKYLKPKRILNSKFGTFGSNSGRSDVQNYLQPHFLSMSATPIPRTIALTIFGDLDLSILDEMPKSRKEIITKIVESKDREKTYQFIRSEAGEGRQIFVICPRIETPEEKQGLIPTQQKMFLAEAKAVKAEFEKLRGKIFPDLDVGMLHGKMKPKEKEDVMRGFQKKDIDILVSTSVVEVGVDIPNATIMMIEDAQKFGLAQLHQFRGRVGRGKDQAYCFLMPGEDGVISQRLQAVVESKNGFELAEKDFKLRGPGDIFGTRQWGIPNRIFDALSDAKLVKEARDAAIEIIKVDPRLNKYPLLEQKLKEKEKTFHRE